MGTWNTLKEVNIDGRNYSVTAGSGFPCLVTAKHTFIDANNILESNINPVQIIKNNSAGDGKYIEAVYRSNPTIVVFYSYKAPDIVSDIRVFNDNYKEDLNTDYVLGIFNHCGGSFSNGISFMDSNKCFSIALFNKTQDEAIDFAINYVHKTKRIGALIVGKNLAFDTIRVESDEYLSISQGP